MAGYKSAHKKALEELGADHPLTLRGAVGYAGQSYENGDDEWDRAAELCDDALKRSRKVLGEFHPDTLDAASTLAEIYADCWGDKNYIDKVSFEGWKGFPVRVSEAHRDNVARARRSAPAHARG